uniref:DUF7824 domain-containing protein n=1 Tax=Streptomyces corallincola TaxID=2851888 RepID=UPI0027E25EC1|nr:DUF6493 family protein [Streptomyces corallincola]
MTDPERRACLPALKAERKQARESRFWEPRRLQAAPALHLAGAGCHTGAAAAAAWLAASDLRWTPAPVEMLLRMLEQRDTGWTAEVARRLAERPASADVPYPLMAGLVSRSGCEVPVTDAYVGSWIRHLSLGEDVTGTLLDRLRREPHLSTLVGGLFTLADVSDVRWVLSRTGPGSWQAALPVLVQEGSLDREFVLDACVARLLRGGGPTDHRIFLPWLTALEPTREEVRARTADWTALARDAVSPVASHAQAVLAGLAADSELTVQQVVEVSEGLLFRTEKKLVRAQLALLGKVLVRDPGAAAELLPVVAQAFGHEDTQVQERALRLVERHVKALGPVPEPTAGAAAGTPVTDRPSDEVWQELHRAAEQLTPSLRPRAAALLGVPVDEAVSFEVYEEMLPPAPEPVRLDPAPETPEELAEEIGALLAAEGDVSTFERALDGLMRHAHRDPEALRTALEPVIGTRWWASQQGQQSDGERLPEVHVGTTRRGFLTPSVGLDLMLAALRGQVRANRLHDAVVRGAEGQECAHSGPARVFDTRLRAIAYRLRTRPLPFLLSTPTWSTGLLEPADLVARLVEYRRLKADVCVIDLGQALLRVRRDDQVAADEAARLALTLGTREGKRVARWLTSGPVGLPGVRRRLKGSRVLLEMEGLPQIDEDMPQQFRSLGMPLSVHTDRWRCHHWDRSAHAHWLAALPERREVMAARMLHDLADLAVDDERGAEILPLLAEGAGEAGEAVHLCLAYGLAARHAEDRLSAVDALLVLAARGQLDAVRLGSALGELMVRGAVKAQRLAESARTAAATGAGLTMWEVLRHALPAPLAELSGAEPAVAAVAARSLGDLLAVAAECAERAGVLGEVPHLAETAARTGSSRMVTQARRLRDTLALEVAA